VKGFHNLGRKKKNEQENKGIGIGKLNPQQGDKYFRG